MADTGGSKVWTLFSMLSALTAALVARKLIHSVWRTTTGKNPPANPASPEVDMKEAVAWAVFSGTLIALARMLATRKAAKYYEKSTGQLPPEMRTDAGGEPLQGTTT